MAPPDTGEREQARKRLARLIESPAEHRSLVPAVVGLLDHADRHVRLSAAFGVCLLANADSDLLEYLVRRLLDRLHDEEARAEVVFAFEYLATQFPAAVDETLQEVRAESDREPLAYTRSGGFRRSNIYSPSMGRGDVGRTRIAGEGQSPGPRQVYSEDADAEDERRRAEPTDDPPDLDDSGPESPAEESGDQSVSSGRADAEPSAPKGLELPTDVLDTVLAESVFDDVTILSRHERQRYADAYRMLGIVSGRERAVSLRVFREPSANRQSFRSDLGSALSAWRSIEDDRVLSLYDWGREPRPWAAVAYAERTLADRDALDPAAAIRDAIFLARAVSALHNTGVVHGGLDSASIAYSAFSVDDVARQRPLVDNVGLIDPFRFAFDPSAYLDPRYAAPEYFDPSFGTIDHATDVYQLGAVCYRLFTGRPPYDVDAGDVQRHVLGGQLRPPSEVDATVPAIVDQIVSKAMARQKLTRYETPAQMEQDLLRAREHVADNG